jgi:DNA-binding MarR family transcriptional regulator
VTGPRSTSAPAVAPDRSGASYASDELPVLLMRTAKAMHDRLAASYTASASTRQMTLVHGFAARYLDTHDNVTTVELAHHLGVTKQSMSEVVSALEKAGFVRRDPHPADRRARVLSLTEVGRRKLRDGRVRWAELEDDWEALVGPDELVRVRAALEAYLDAYPLGSEPGPTT